MELPSHLLARKPDHVGARNHSEIVKDENGKVEVGTQVCDGNCDWDNWPENIDSHGSAARGSPADFNEVEGVYTCPTTLSLWLDTINRDISNRSFV